MTSYISTLNFLQLSSLQDIHPDILLLGCPLPTSSRYMVVSTLYGHLYNVWSSSMQNVLLMNAIARRAAGLPFFQDIAASPIVR